MAEGKPLTVEEAEQAWRVLRDGQFSSSVPGMLVRGICDSGFSRAACLALTVPEVRDVPDFVERLSDVVCAGEQAWWAYRTLLFLTPFREGEERIVFQLRSVVENSGDRRCLYFLHRYVDELPHSQS